MVHRKAVTTNLLCLQVCAFFSIALADPHHAGEDDDNPHAYRIPHTVLTYVGCGGCSTQTQTPFPTTTTITIEAGDSRHTAHHPLPPFRLLPVSTQAATVPSPHRQSSICISPNTLPHTPTHPRTTARSSTSRVAGGSLLRQRSCTEATPVT